MTHNYKKLKVWQLAMEIAVDVYQLSLLFPKDEQFGMVSQIKRCSLSIPSNIAEGSGRNSDKDFSRFLSMALGSSNELETQLILSNKLNLIHEDAPNAILKKNSEVQKMIFKLRNNLINN
ncbi:MAG: four helix bundle protein [Bacteroidetes bacterium]|nr:four helix bundle protein [Bacteroidota bacterium]